MTTTKRAGNISPSSPRVPTPPRPSKRESICGPRIRAKGADSRRALPCRREPQACEISIYSGTIKCQVKNGGKPVWHNISPGIDQGEVFHGELLQELRKFSCG